MGDAKPIVLGEISDKIIPSLILIFDGLKRAYQARAQADEEEETDEDDDECEGITKANNCVSLAIKYDIIFTEGISSDEDEIDEMGPNYFERISKLAASEGAKQGFEVNVSIKDDSEDDDDDDDDDSGDELDETALEGYTTPIDDEDSADAIDEYVAFQEVMKSRELLFY